MKALFFVEGGLGIGLGHLRRSSAVADALKDRSWACQFIVPQPAAAQWLSGAGHKAIVARAESSRHLPATDYATDLFVLDSYRVANTELEKKVRRRAHLIAAFDDDMFRSKVADVIINSGLEAPRMAWPRRDRVLHLMGPRFHPLPAEYLPLKSRRLRKQVSNILVTLGGTGSKASLRKILAVINKVFPRASVDCALGPFAAKGATAFPAARVRFHPHCLSIKYFLLGCDLAVTGSGQTLFELSATGTPGIGIALSENQRKNLEGFRQAGAILSVGFPSHQLFAKKLEDCLKRIKGGPLRRYLSRQGQGLIDGCGASRIAEALSKHLARN
jgi:spore coat polysaccharide biosynthesis predicted glycosyltransferase SpsG